MNTTDNIQYLPWTWTVKPSDPNAHCPSASGILGTFAIVNVLVGLVGLIFGNRVVTNYISCGCFGKLGSTGWHHMWILTLALQFGSNALIATIIKNTAGYENDFAITQLMLLFIARPRLSWILMSVFSSFRRKTKEKTKTHPAMEYTEEFFLERPWESSFMSQLIAEVILQLINLSTTGRIANFAATHGYYKLNHDYYSLPRGAHLMYAGALLYTVALPLFLMSYPMPFFFAARRRRYSEKDAEKTMLSDTSLTFTQSVVRTLAISTWLASWLIWSGYVLLAGDL